MKKRANLITRVALAATIFVTALAGVTPMTAKAGTPQTFEEDHSGTIYRLTINPGEGDLLTYTPDWTNPEEPTLPSATNVKAPAGKKFKEASVVTSSTWTGAGTSTDPKIATSTISYEDGQLTSIELTTPATKKDYTVGQSFDKSGMVVTAKYSDGATDKDVSSVVSISPTTFTSAGTIPVTVTYEGKTATQNVTVTAATPEKPAKPTLEISGASISSSGTYTTPLDSVLCSLTGLSTADIQGGARYRYTLDGSNPTATTENVSTGSFSVNGGSGETVTIKVIAEKGGVASDIAAAQVTFNYSSSTAFSITASATTYDKNASNKSAIKITGAGTNKTIYAVTSGSNVNIATINSDGTATLETSYLDKLASGVYEFKAWNTTSPTRETDTINITITGTNVTGTLAEIESVKWRSNYNGADLGSISSMGKTYTDNPRTAVYEVGGEIEFANGTPFADIISELKKSSQVDIDLNKESDVHHGSVTWLTASKKSSTLPYNNSEADSDQMNTYDIDSKKEDSFIVYSEPIEIWSEEDKYHIDSAGTKNIRLKLKVKILKEGETANTSTSTGSSAPTNLTFNPGDGTYVTPNSIIRFSATASSGTVKYNVTSGNIPPTTSNGADGANGVTIPGSVSAGDYKMNVNAYTNSSNTTTKSATFKVVTNNKYNVTYDNGVLTCDGDFGNFKGLWITNAAGQYEFVPAANYAVASGSTVVTLSPTYLMTQTGAKSVRMVYTDGYAEGNFTLTAGSSNTPTNITDPTAGNTNTSGGTQGGGRSGVGTDDRSELVIMFVLLGMLIAGFVVSVYYKNEKLRRNRYMD